MYVIHSDLSLKFLNLVVWLHAILLVLIFYLGSYGPSIIAGHIDVDTIGLYRVDVLMSCDLP